jgi:ATPase family associated with various cellular activities (AAA)/Winged helix domain, variant
MAQQQSWQQTNKEYLVARLASIRQLLRQAAENTGEHTEIVFERPETEAEPPSTSALETLGALFDLTPFESDLLLLCAGIELDSEFPALCAAAQGEPSRPYPTFSMALALFPGAFWDALNPGAALRYWRLIEIEEGQLPLTQRPLHIDEHILHYLLGTTHLDARLARFFRPIPVFAALVPSHQQIAERLATIWVQNPQSLPIIQLCGNELQSKQQIASVASTLVGSGLCSLSAATLPAQFQDLHNILHLWERESLLSKRMLFLNCDTLNPADAALTALITQLIEQHEGILIVSCQERPFVLTRPTLVFDVHKPTLAEQQAVWLEALEKRGIEGNGQVKRLTAYFHLDSGTIHAISASIPAPAAYVAQQPQAPPETIEAALWDLCRKQARPRLDHLAQPIEPLATWDDLILPGLQLDLLHEITIQARQRNLVYDTWGFRQKSSYGLGISALFFGASGVGKTMAAEVLARELELDLYRVDLSETVSKYIGETEKNLRQIFDAAEESSVILLFDEADALFGKRGDVKDSHDRYANIEVSYLLQRMESYRGLAILTTNMKDILDTAFLRRIRFLVQFPFPDAAQRAEIWRRIFPPTAPTEGLDSEKLAQLTIAGGTIRTIALNAAFLAAEAGEPIRMSHILRVTRHEYAKLEKSLASETRGWI